MNKYEKALDELSACAMKKTYDYDYDDNLIVDYEYLEDEELGEFVKPLQELVDKATPKKAILVHSYDGKVYECPNCHMEFRPDYIMNHIKWNGCPYCLQKLDWSEE